MSAIGLYVANFTWISLKLPFVPFELEHVLCIISLKNGGECVAPKEVHTPNVSYVE